MISPARPVVRIRIGRPVSRSQARNRPRRPGRGSMGSGGGSSPYPPAGHSARRIVMMATSGHEDAELRLDDRREHREDRGPLRAVAPQLAQAEQQEHDAERVDLAPHGAVEPADRVEDEEQGREQRHRLARSELAGHRPGEVADRRIGQDRRELDQVADAAQPRSDRADEPQDVHVARGVVDEPALVERSRTLGRQAARPPLERDDVGPEP